MLINNSPDITNLQVAVRWDISELTPFIFLENKSTGSGLANMSYAFVAKSPSGTFIHNGDINAPDKTGVWATHTITGGFPRPFNQLEWSGAEFSFYVVAKDSNGNVYTRPVQSAQICRPVGNTKDSKNTFGKATSDVEVKCEMARVFFNDTTYHSYQGNEGERVYSSLKVIYPIDETETVPAPFSITDYSTALIPISYSAANYQYLQKTIYDYDLGDNVTIRVRYQSIETFAVWCNVDLNPLVCEFNKLIDSVNNGTCRDVESANKKLALIAPKMTLVFIGKMQPKTGINVPNLIDDIKEIGGFEADCCGANTGIIPTSNSIIDGYNFSVNGTGDVTGNVTVNGSNIIFNVGDFSYIVTVSNTSPSTSSAFSFTPTQTGTQKTYALNVDANILSYDILNEIKNDAALVNLFNSIVTTSGSKLLVDGKCIFTTSTSCDYTFTVLGVPANTSFTILSGINNQTVNFAFNQTNLPALQTYLNGLNLGAFVVTDQGGGSVLISSATNTKNLTSLTYNIGSTSYIANMTRDCLGYTPISASEAVQNLIDFLCGIKDSDIETSQNYSICYVDPTDKIKKTVVISGGAALSDFIAELIARGCDTIDYMMSLGAVTCDSITAQFPASTKLLQPTDYILGKKEGSCAKIAPLEFGTRMFELGTSNSNFMAALCNAVSMCGAGKICEPFNYYNLSVADTSPTSDSQDLILDFDHPSAISYTVKYARIDNTSTPVYTTIPSVLSSPHVIPNVTDGQYNVEIIPIYADGRKCTGTMKSTPLCSGVYSFNAVLGGSPTGIVVSYSVDMAVGNVRVNVYYPNGGSSSQVYTNDGNDININTPAGVYGDYSVTLQPVCNAATGFYGQATAPATVSYPNPNPVVSPLSVSLSRTGTAGGGTLTAFIDGGQPPYTYTFSCVTTGLCGTCTIDNPTGSLAGTGGIATASSTFTGTVYDGVTYQITCSVTDGASTTVLSNTVSTPMCLVPYSKIKMVDGGEKDLGELTVGEQLFGQENFVEKLSDSTTGKLYSFNDGLLESTEGHVHIVNGQEIHAIDIKKGDYFTDEFGEKVGIYDIEIKEGEFEVVDIVTTNHTYYANGILTHNKIACP